MGIRSDLMRLQAARPNARLSGLDKTIFSVNGNMHLRCLGCGQQLPVSFVFRCPTCGNALEAEYPAGTELDLGAGRGLKRFEKLLPFVISQDFDCPETPCVVFEPDGFANPEVQIFCKLEGVLPTDSTKYRQCCVAVPGFLWGGVNELVIASTGNTASSYAYWAAKLDGALKLHLFVPSSLRSRLRFLGPAVTVHEHDVDYVEAGHLARRYASEHGLFLEGGFFNFFRREGLKTAYLEGAAQMKFAVDLVFQAVSSGIGFYAGYSAFRQLKSAGYIEKMPRFICVQQDTCAPMVSAFNRGRDSIAADDIVRNPVGLAQSILRGDPTATYPYILKVVRETNGTFVAPSQADIVSSFDALNRRGMTACHTSATVLAAWKNLVQVGAVEASDRAMLMLTGGRDA